MEDTENERGAPRKLDDDDQIVTYLLSIEKEFEANKPVDEIEILVGNVYSLTHSFIQTHSLASLPR